VANSITAYTPELWSQTGLMILAENIRIPKLVRRDFSTDLAQAGDTVNTRKPAKMTAGTVDPSTGITIMDVSATNVAVTLNKHEHASFKITDREQGRSFVNLVDEFLRPAMLALANSIDKNLLGLYTDFATIIDVSSAGNWKDKINVARTRLNKLLAPSENRALVLSDDDDGAIGNLDNILKVNESGTNAALREGQIGRIKGFDTYRSSNVVNVGSPGVRHNLAFHRDAIALVTRVLAPAVGQALGCIQKTASDPDAGVSMRLTMSYNPTLLASQVTVDTLYGVKTLDNQLGVVVRSSF
jgi:hypothetical protein